MSYQGNGTEGYPVEAFASAAATTVVAMAAALRSSQADLMVASYVDLDRADTIAGVQMLESAGLIGVGRADTILTTAVTDVERYRA